MVVPMLRITVTTPRMTVTTVQISVTTRKNVMLLKQHNISDRCNSFFCQFRFGTLLNQRCKSYLQQFSAEA
jgi:hypothetical protein